MLLEALPPVLILYLERFLYDAATDDINKIIVQFMPELEIPPGTGFSFIPPCSPRLRIVRGSVGLGIMAPVAGKYAEPVHYKLYGVLYHHGESARTSPQT